MKTERPFNLRRYLSRQSVAPSSRGDVLRQATKQGRRPWLWACAALLAGSGALVSCADKDDLYHLDERTPAGWDVSIYSWLAGQGNFQNTVRLIDDLNYREVLDKTGSKTIFVADDDAFKRFFQKNDWGVTSYEQLSTSQKRLLLYGSMIDNSYQVQELSSTQGHVEGNCMRRPSSISIYDSVTVMRRADVPKGPYWNMYRDRDSLVVMQDMSAVPMIHFIERFMTNKQLTNDDYDFLYNYETHRATGDASVNGAQIVEQNIRCLNGFVNRMSEVVTPLPNMAQIIMSKPNTTQFAHLLRRYETLDYCGDDATRAYNANRGTQVDSVFQLRYFSDRSQGSGTFSETHNQKCAANGRLTFDPGWNGYYVPSSNDAETALQQDMAVMLVPSDEALTEYWERGAGAALRLNFGSWDNVPYSTLTEFMRANMIQSLVSSVPSKFQFMMNDAADPLGITKADVDSVYLACNGAVYLTNHVFTPTSFVSVMYPTVVDQRMSIILWAIKQMKYDAYLNSLNSRYSFFLPSNDAMLEYIDPASYGKAQRQLLRFHYDAKRTGNEVYASIHNIDPATGEVGDSIGNYTNSNGMSLDWNPILNRLYNILDDHVVVGDVEDGHEYYRTKGGSIIHVSNVGQGANGMTVEQLNGESASLPIDYVYDQTNGGNGKTYILEEGPLVGTRQTVLGQLSKHPEFDRFRELLLGSELLETVHDGKYACSDTCISVFDNYHYTVYVPSNASIDALIAQGKLHTWDDVAELDTLVSDQKKLYERYTDEINSFLRYHIQDNAFCIGADNTTENSDFDQQGNASAAYETAYIDKVHKTFNKLTIITDKAGSHITIRDKAGNERHVVTTQPGLYNIMAREFTYQGTDKSTATLIHNSSSAVIHLIDGPLLTE